MSNIRAICGWQRYMNASMKKTPCWAATSVIATTWPAVIPAGFSHSTGLPARIAMIANSA